MQCESAPSIPYIPPYGSDAQRDMRVVRGNILIKNTLDGQGLDEFSDNINLFHKGFNLRKDNPLYQSDEDLHRRNAQEERRRSDKEDEIRRQRETLEELQRQRDRVNEIGHGLEYETVDRYTKTNEGNFKNV